MRFASGSSFVDDLNDTFRLAGFAGGVESSFSVSDVVCTSV